MFAQNDDDFVDDFRSGMNLPGSKKGMPVAPAPAPAGGAARRNPARNAGCSGAQKTAGE
jgi:hypothetical protein